MGVDAQLVNRLHASLGSRAAISKEELAERLARVLCNYGRLSREKRDDDAAERLLQNLRLIAGHAARIERIAHKLKLPKQTKLGGLRLAFVPDEALLILARAASDFLDHLGETERMPRLSKSRGEKVLDRLLWELAELWTQATELQVTFTTNPVTNEVTGRFLEFFWEATQGIGLSEGGAAIKSRFNRLKKKSQRRRKSF